MAAMVVTAVNGDTAGGLGLDLLTSEDGASRTQLLRGGPHQPHHNGGRSAHGGLSGFGGE